MRLLPALALALWSLTAVPVTAQQQLTAGEFEKIVTGRTLFFNRLGEAFGAEQYLSGRRVIWAFVDGSCQQGEWYESGGEICFDYEDMPEDICWNFFSDGIGVRARIPGEDPMFDLRAVADSDEPLKCVPPGLGV